MAINPTTESLFIALILEQQKMINKLIARELTDRIIARQEHLDDYLENVTNGKTQYIFERHLDRINNILRECEYFGSLVKQEKIEESELLGHDRYFVAEIWSELKIKGESLVR
jgi:hypothetical protein